MVSPKIGVLVAQLGTPDAPTAKALRPYLKQFLSDMRVIDYPPWIWQPILRGIILNTRPRRSARLYQRIWLPEGSPLLVYTQAQADHLQEQLGDDYRVIIGMTYGNPSIASAIATLEEEDIDRIVVLPLFPQFSSTTTASIYDAVYRAAAGRRCPLFHERKRAIPTLRFVPPYYNHSQYIEAMAIHLRQQVQEIGEAPDKFIITFHGIPRRYVQTGDPYRRQCEETAQLLAERMGWTDDDWQICFQSRFGPEQWLEPYTDATLEHLPKQGVKRPLVFSPGFVTDCLETLDELGNEGREAFVEGGGDHHSFHLAPCLNAHPAFIDTLASIVRRESMGWNQGTSSEYRGTSKNGFKVEG
jgi:ferrochelatase